MILVEDANTKKLNEITSSYLEEFQDKETRHIYVDEFLNAKIATQIKVLREQNGWSQDELAEKTGMKQERISVLEDVNYSAWTLHTLRRLAEAFDLRINVSFEDFGSFLNEFADFNRTSLERQSFKDDSTFKKEKELTLISDRQPIIGVEDVKLKTGASSTSADKIIPSEQLPLFLDLPRGLPKRRKKDLGEKWQDGDENQPAKVLAFPQNSGTASYRLYEMNTEEQKVA